MQNSVSTRFRDLALSSALMGLLASGAMASEILWTGGAGNGVWSDGGNWQGGSAPGAADTAVFNGAATVSPPVSFAGVIRVAGSGCVTANVAADAEFTLALGAKDFMNTGASFRKTGNGTLTLHALGGVNPGTVTVAEGAVRFAGNGTLAPGAFDHVVVESGATATVVDSPIASCRGYAYRLGKGALQSDGTSSDDYSVIQRDSVATMVANYENWTYVPTENTRHEGIQIVGDDTAAFDAGATPASVYASYCSSDGSGSAAFMVYYRGLFLSENPGSMRWQITQTTGNGAAVRIGFNSTPVYGEWKKPRDGIRNFASASVPRGWAAFTYQSANDLRWTSAGYYGFNLRHPAAYEGDSGVLTGSKLWNGICFTSLEVASGASLTIADGQAMAIANARAFKVEGAFASASADALLFLGSDWSVEENDAPLSAAALRAFSGTVEIGPTSRLGGDDSTTPVSYTITGSGELTITPANQNAVLGFQGSLRVASGASYELPIIEPDWSGLTEKAALAPVSSDNWQITENTAWASGGASITVLDPAVSVYRSAIIAKTPIPLYCPFEFSCDVHHGGNMNDKDGFFGLFVQTKGLALDYSSDAWASRAWYMLPYSGNVFGTRGYFLESWGAVPNVGWITNAMSKVSWSPNNYSAQYSWGATPISSWGLVAGKPMRWRLRYDGFGTFTATVWRNAENDATIVESRFTDPRLTEAKFVSETWYPSILACMNSSVSHSALTVSNISFKVLSAPVAVPLRLTLEHDATLMVKGCRVDDGGTAAWKFPNLTMDDGATLAIAPYFSGLATGISTEGLTVTGAAEIVPASGENVSTVVADFTSRTGGGLTVSGDVSVAEPLMVDVARSELMDIDDAVTLLDASHATAVPVLSLEPAVRDIEGSNKPIAVSYSGGYLRANAHMGTVLYIR